MIPAIGEQRFEGRILELCFLNQFCMICTRAKSAKYSPIGEKGLAVLKTGCLGTNQGVGLIACSVMIDTNLRGLAGVENVERNGES